MCRLTLFEKTIERKKEKTIILLLLLLLLLILLLIIIINIIYCKPPSKLDQLIRCVKTKQNETETYVIKIAYDDAFTKDTF